MTSTIALPDYLILTSGDQERRETPVEATFDNVSVVFSTNETDELPYDVLDNKDWDASNIGTDLSPRYLCSQYKFSLAIKCNKKIFLYQDHNWAPSS